MRKLKIPKLKIKKGYCLIVATDTTENLCRNCFFCNPDRGSVDKKTSAGCLRSIFVECPSKAHLKNGKNMIYKLTKIKEAQDA